MCIRDSIYINLRPVEEDAFPENKLPKPEMIEDLGEYGTIYLVNWLYTTKEIGIGDGAVEHSYAPISNRILNFMDFLEKPSEESLKAIYY